MSRRGARADWLHRATASGNAGLVSRIAHNVPGAWPTRSGRASWRRSPACSTTSPTARQSRAPRADRGRDGGDLHEFGMEDHELSRSSRRSATTTRTTAILSTRGGRPSSSSRTEMTCTAPGCAIPDMIRFDIHDRVNHAVEKSFLNVDDDRKHITLERPSTRIFLHVMEYFEIFMTRMMASRKAGQVPGNRSALGEREPPRLTLSGGSREIQVLAAGTAAVLVSCSRATRSRATALRGWHSVRCRDCATRRGNTEDYQREMNKAVDQRCATEDEAT